MKKYRVTDITVSGLALFIDEEYEADDKIECKEAVLYEIMDNLGNYIDIEVEEIEDEELEEGANKE